MQRNGASVAETEEIGAIDVQIIEERRRIVRRLLEAKRPVGDVYSAPAALLFKCDDLPLGCQQRQDPAERRPDRVAAAMQQHERKILAIRNAVNLIINAEAVHRRISALKFLFHFESCAIALLCTQCGCITLFFPWLNRRFLRRGL